MRPGFVMVHNCGTVDDLETPPQLPTLAGMRHLRLVDTLRIKNALRQSAAAQRMRLDLDRDQRNHADLSLDDKTKDAWIIETVGE